MIKGTSDRRASGGSKVRVQLMWGEKFICETHILFGPGRMSTTNLLTKGFTRGRRNDDLVILPKLMHLQQSINTLKLRNPEVTMISR